MLSSILICAFLSNSSRLSLSCSSPKKSTGREEEDLVFLTNTTARRHGGSRVPLPPEDEETSASASAVMSLPVYPAFVSLDPRKISSSSPSLTHPSFLFSLPTTTSFFVTQQSEPCHSWNTSRFFSLSPDPPFSLLPHFVTHTHPLLSSLARTDKNVQKVVPKDLPSLSLSVVPISALEDEDTYVR